jgi:hypothetical protein
MAESSRRRIRRKTETLRTLVKQEARVILEPETDVLSVDDAELGRPIRRVQVLVPPREGTLFGIDVDPGADGIGPDRLYKLPTLTAGAQIDFVLLPDQWITAGAENGMVVLSLIVEYGWENA